MGCCVSNENPELSQANVHEKEIDPLESLLKVPTFDLKAQEPEETAIFMSETEVEEIKSLERQLKTLLGNIESE